MEPKLGYNRLKELREAQGLIQEQLGEFGAVKQKEESLLLSGTSTKSSIVEYNIL
jgi:transcriptional regulator with XRE-family HTH domain